MKFLNITVSVKATSRNLPEPPGTSRNILPMYTITVEDTFSAAHSLRNYKGKCESLHGHNWKIRVSLRGKQLADGLLMDFTEAKSILQGVLSSLDHRFLNEEAPFFKEHNPTSEHIALYIFKEFKKQSTHLSRATLHAVEVWETEKCSASYREDNET